MKTINLTIDEETWREARILAAKRDTSVSALVREALREMTGQYHANADAAEKERDRLERKELVDMLRACNLVLGYKPSREKTYER